MNSFIVSYQMALGIAGLFAADSRLTEQIT